MISPGPVTLTSLHSIEYLFRYRPAGATSEAPEAHGGRTGSAAAGHRGSSPARVGLRVTGVSEPAGVPRVRASDADREQVADLIRRAVGDGRLTLGEGDERLAAAYGATHRGDLVPITEDLEPVARTRAPPTAPSLEKQPHPSGSAPAPRRAPVPDAAPGQLTTSVGILGGAERRGEWTPGRVHRAVAVMGGVEIDLRGAAIGPHGMSVRAVAIMGGVVVVVDEDTVVEEHGSGIAGGFADSSGPPRAPGGPRVRVTGLAVMGGVEVQRRGRRGELGGRPGTG